MQEEEKTKKQIIYIISLKKFRAVIGFYVHVSGGGIIGFFALLRFSRVASLFHPAVYDAARPLWCRGDARGSPFWSPVNDAAMTFIKEGRTTNYKTVFFHQNYQIYIANLNTQVRVQVRVLVELYSYYQYLMIYTRYDILY